MFAVDIPREDFQNFKNQKKTDALLRSVEIYKPDPNIHKSHDYQPRVKLPVNLWKISPAIRSQIGGPDGFYFGDLSLSIHSETIIRRNVRLSEAPSYGESIIAYDATSKGAVNYLNLAQELIKKNI